MPSSALPTTNQPNTTVQPGDVETDVLVVGSGPAGSTAALALATHGIAHVVVSRYHNTANTPRAHISNQRTMEVFRDFGIQDQADRDSTPHAKIGETVFCTAINGEELGRLRSWGVGPERHADYEMASPTLNCDLPQTYAEPLLVRNAMARGSRYRWSTEYVSLIQDAEGVHVLVRDRLTGTEYTIHARYVIGADGARSRVAEDINLPLVGQMGKSGSINIHCKMDLTKWCENRESVLYWVLQPGASVGGIGLGLVRMVRPWNEWLVTWGYDIEQEPPQLDDQMAEDIVRQLIGDADLDIEVLDHSMWTVNEMYATRNSAGRVFCVGDAVHRHPPSNGLGSNTSIQDSFNLGWKLAYVLKGWAGAELLDSYNDERVPVGEQIVKRANKSITEFGGILEALGLDPRDDTETMQRQIATRKDASPEGELRRQALRDALVAKNYEFNAHGVEMGQRYESTAIAPDGTPWPEYTRDPELYFHPTTHPGARLPHVWIAEADPTKAKISTLDLCGHGEFTLLTGINGGGWVAAAGEIAAELGIPLNVHQIGAGGDFEDLYGDWARLREVTDEGAILVRPDHHVAWRSLNAVTDPAAALSSALNTVLARGSQSDQRSKGAASATAPATQSNPRTEFAAVQGPR
ncbi:FAD-dependent oxidoreductase [Corynebacterium sp. A21]|uniref:FAD-dependent oxidoreductase n=1 Tax=Corynebacterium sp. A21 TaxID=3457318 RepID=UPI003FD62546